MNNNLSSSENVSAEQNKSADLSASHTIRNPSPAFSTDASHKLQHSFGLGCVAAGNGMKLHSDEEVKQTLQTAWDLGVRYYDTSPRYGNGLSERRLGQFLFNQPREDYVLSSKVGRLFWGDPGYSYPEDAFWQGKTYENFHYDYSASGVRRSIEDTLNRMGLPYLDYVFVHDIDSFNSDIDWQEKFKECEKGAFPELSRMREEGMIRGWGLGVNEVEPIMRALQASDPDISLLAQQYSLITHQEALERLFPEAKKCNMQIVLGGIFESGFLAGKDRYAYKPENVTAELREKRAKLDAIAKEYRVDLRTASLQFALAPDAVTSVLVGASTPEQIQQNIDSLTVQIPDGFWQALKDNNLIMAQADTIIERPIKL